MKFFILLCFVVAIGCAGANLLTDVMAAEWQNYKADYGKDYDSHREDLARFMIYSENKLKIAEHNKKFAEGKVTYEMGLNEFSDWTFEEFAEKRLMRNDSLNFQFNNNFMQNYMTPQNYKAPDSVDWREKGAVTEVKDQGNCGSCWAFASTGTIEGQLYIKKKKLVSLSEQNLLDCSGGSCNGYSPNSALKYVIDNKGIDTEESYPYEAKKNQCQFKSENVGATIKSIGLVDNEENLLNAVASVGPIAVTIAVDDKFFKYDNTIYNGEGCLEHVKGYHAVLVVGYSKNANNGYWIVKNSWGNGWGDKGYIRMRMGSNVCGIGKLGAIYAIV